MLKATHCPFNYALIFCLIGSLWKFMKELINFNSLLMISTHASNSNMLLINKTHSWNNCQSYTF